MNPTLYPSEDSYAFKFTTFNRTTILDEEDVAEQPKNITIPLYIHQRLCLQKMLKLEQTARIEYTAKDSRIFDEDNIKQMSTNYGFLADEPGYGKSLTMLAVIAIKPSLDPRDIIDQLTTGQNFSYTSRAEDLYSSKVRITANLIIMQAGLVQDQWHQYCDQHTSGLRIHNISRANHLPSRKNDDNYVTTLVNFFNQFDIVLLGDTMYENLPADFVSSVLFSRLIIDEADSIRIKYGVKNGVPLAVFTWFITASVSNLMNIHSHQMEFEDNREHYNQKGIRCHASRFSASQLIKSLLKEYPLHKRTIQNTVIVRNSLEFIKKTISIPTPVFKQLFVKDNKIYSMVQGIVSDDIMRMINAGDEQSAINSLNISESDEANLIIALTANLETKLHNLMNEKNMRENHKFSSENARKQSLESIEEQICAAKSDIEKLKSRVEYSMGSEECPICYEDFVNVECKMMITCCKSVSCSKCMLVHLANKNLCFNCRGPITQDMVRKISSGSGSSSLVQTKIGEMKQDLYKTKTEALKSILEELDYKNVPLKILIFSDFDNSYFQLVDLMSRMGIHMERLQGNTSQKLETFNNATKSTVLFLNSNFCGAGINITSATQVIQWHQIPENKVKQIIGRAQRINRTTTLGVYQIFFENEK